MFRVNASLPNTRSKKGIRAGVYRLAESRLAFCIHHKSGITYEGNHLKVQLYFKQEAQAMLFESDLSNWNYDKLVTIDDPVVQSVVPVAAPSPDMQRLLLRQYNPIDFPSDAGGSPLQNLAELRGSVSESSEASFALSDDDVTKYQSIESLFFIHGAHNKGYRMHLKNQGKSFHFDDLRHNENNMLIGSCCFHQAFDGMNNETGMPTIAIKPADKIESQDATDSFVTDSGGRKRFKIFLDVDFYDDLSAQFLSRHFKEGSEKIGDKTWRTFVHVTDVVTFKDCLNWKHKDTTEKWKVLKSGGSDFGDVVVDGDGGGGGDGNSLEASAVRADAAVPSSRAMGAAAAK